MPIGTTTLDAASEHSWEPGDYAWYEYRINALDAIGDTRTLQRVRVIGGWSAPMLVPVEFADGERQSVFVADLSSERPATLGPARIATTPGAQQESWAPGETAWFEYHCSEATDSADAPAWFHSHQQVTVLRANDADPAAADTAAERGEQGVPLTYRVRFEDGLEWDAFEDELLTSADGFVRPDPPHVVRDEPVDMEGFSRLTGLAVATLRTYRKDGRLPAPDGTFGKVAWWYTTTVRVWVESRPGRWPKP